MASKTQPNRELFCAEKIVASHRDQVDKLSCVFTLNNRLVAQNGHRNKRPQQQNPAPVQKSKDEEKSSLPFTLLVIVAATVAFVYFLGALLFFVKYAVETRNPWVKPVPVVSAFHSLSASDIDGNVIPFTRYAGKVVLVVNVASMCGFTKNNYIQLTELQNRFGPDKFVILAFPCSQFGNQEPGTAAEIKDFVKHFNVTFPIFAKIDVNGDNAHPVYKLLKSQPPLDYPIKWNFSKFLVDKNGNVLKRYEPMYDIPSIADDIVPLL